jgi:hypothetical protein
MTSLPVKQTPLRPLWSLWLKLLMVILDSLPAH